jgi:tellurite resistance protein
MTVDAALLTKALRTIHPGKLSAEDAETVVALAQMSVDADGQEDADEIKMFFTLGKGVYELAGLTDTPTPTFADDDDENRITTLAKSLATSEARELAYAVANLLTIVDVQIQPEENEFLEKLAEALGLSVDRAEELAAQLGEAITPMD